jgi:hypothetical protein
MVMHKDWKRAGIPKLPSPFDSNFLLLILSVVILASILIILSRDFSQAAFSARHSDPTERD